MNINLLDYGFKAGDCIVHFQTYNNIYVELRDVQYRAVDTIRGSLHFVRADDGQSFELMKRDHRDPTYTAFITRQWDKGDVPYKTKKAVLDAIVKAVNDLACTEVVQKELIAAERVFRADATQRMKERANELEQDLRTAKLEVQTAEHNEWEWIHKHYPNDPAVVAG